MVVDDLRAFLMTEMPCTGNGYIAAVWCVLLRAIDRIGQYVWIGVPA